MANRIERVNVGVMMAGQGLVADVFDATASFMKERRRKEEAQLRAKRAYSPAQEEARRLALIAVIDIPLVLQFVGDTCKLWWCCGLLWLLFE